MWHTLDGQKGEEAAPLSRMERARLYCESTCLYCEFFSGDLKLSRPQPVLFLKPFKFFVKSHEVQHLSLLLWHGRALQIV